MSSKFSMGKVSQVPYRIVYLNFTYILIHAVESPEEFSTLMRSVTHHETLAVRLQHTTEAHTEESGLE